MNEARAAFASIVRSLHRASGARMLAALLLLVAGAASVLPSPAAAAAAPPSITSPVDGTFLASSFFLVEGTGEPGATITIFVTGATFQETTTVDDSGHWAASVMAPFTATPEGFDISATQQGPDGVPSLPSDVVHLLNYVPAPVITAPPTGSVILTPTFSVTGTGMVGASVMLQGATMVPYFVTVDELGQWAVFDIPTPNPAPPTGFDMSATQNFGGALPGPTSNIVHLTTTLLPPVITSPIDGTSAPTNTTVTGTGAPGAVVTVLDGAATIGTAPVDDAGNFTLNVTLSDGAHSLTATQLLSGSTSDVSNAVAITVNELRTPIVTTVIHNAMHSVVTLVPHGTVVHPRVEVRGNGPVPSGGVTVDWFDTQSCSLAPVATSDFRGEVLVNGAVDLTTFAQTVAYGWAYAFRASYGGDTKYSPAEGPCVALNISRLTPVVEAVIHDEDHAVVTWVRPGTEVHVRALVSGSGRVPTGDIRFVEFWQNAECSGFRNDSAATSAALSADGAVDVTWFTKDLRFHTAFAFKAYYGGDDFHTSAESPCIPVSIVDYLTPTLTTAIHDASHSVVTSVPVHTVVHYSVQVSGSAGGPIPTGTVTVSWYLNGVCMDVPHVGSNDPLSVSGALDDAAAFSVAPLFGRPHSMRVHYLGDTTYGAFTGPCDMLLVTDTIPPTIFGAVDIDVPATSAAGAVVTYSVSASDNADSVTLPRCSPPSGSTFAIGQTTVTCTARDSSGNEATATFIVRVRGADEQLAAIATLLDSVDAGKRVDRRLLKVTRALGRDQQRQVCRNLERFISQVEDEVAAGRLTIADGAALTGAARRVGVVLGCP